VIGLIWRDKQGAVHLCDSGGQTSYHILCGHKHVPIRACITGDWNWARDVAEALIDRPYCRTCARLAQIEQSRVDLIAERFAARG